MQSWVTATCTHFQLIRYDSYGQWPTASTMTLYLPLQRYFCMLKIDYKYATSGKIFKIKLAHLLSLLTVNMWNRVNPTLTCGNTQNLYSDPCGWKSCVWPFQPAILPPEVDISCTLFYKARGAPPEMMLEVNLLHHSLKHWATDQAAAFDAMGEKTSWCWSVRVTPFFSRSCLMQFNWKLFIEAALSPVKMIYAWIHFWMNAKQC